MADDKTGSIYVIDAADWARIQLATTTATSSLTVASTAAAFARVDTVRHAAEATINVVNVIHVAARPADVPAGTVEKLQSRIDDLESVQANYPMTQSFRCHRDFKICNQQAAGIGGKLTCMLTYVACMAAELTTLVNADRR